MVSCIFQIGIFQESISDARSRAIYNMLCNGSIVYRATITVSTRNVWCYLGNIFHTKMWMDIWRKQICICTFLWGVFILSMFTFSFRTGIDRTWIDPFYCKICIVELAASPFNIANSKSLYRRDKRASNLMHQHPNRECFSTGTFNVQQYWIYTSFRWCCSIFKII